VRAGERATLGVCFSNTTQHKRQHNNIAAAMSNEKEIIDKYLNVMLVEVKNSIEAQRKRILEDVMVRASASVPNAVPVIPLQPISPQFQVTVRVMADVADHRGDENCDNEYANVYFSDDENEDVVRTYTLSVSPPAAWMEELQRCPKLLQFNADDLLKDKAVVAYVDKYIEKRAGIGGGSGYCKASKSGRKHDWTILSIVPLVINQIR
jgi:hypothetical protein